MGKWIRDPDDKFAPHEPKRGRRHSLLLYTLFNESVFWPAVLIMAVAGGLLIWQPSPMARYRVHLFVAVAATALALLLTFAFRLQAFVQCRRDGLYVQTPLQRLTIPYDQIRTTRPNVLHEVFPPASVRWTQRSFLDPVYGKTAVVVELYEYPRPAAWLRLWMGPFLICRDVTGLVLLVGDWMTLRGEIDEYVGWWRRRPAEP